MTFVATEAMRPGVRVLAENRSCKSMLPAFAGVVELTRSVVGDAR